MAENLWALREQKKISVAGLANRAGLPIGLIMEYESGQKSIDPRHLSRLARALYVEDSDIKLQSDPRPGATPLERRGTGEPNSAPAMETAAVASARQTAPPPRGRERSGRPRTDPRPPAPPRPSQVAHLGDLLVRLGRTQAEVEAAIGKPISSLDRSAMSQLLKGLQEEARKITVERHRAYLPEGVDHYETRYLSAAVASGHPFRFTLFDGKVVQGKIVGFGPYTITVNQEDGVDVTLNKLALVSYMQSPNGSATQRPEQ